MKRKQRASEMQDTGSAAPAEMAPSAKRRARFEKPRLSAVNENWAELQSKLGKNPKKHKQSPGVQESHASLKEVTVEKLQRLPEPSNSDCSLTKVIAMDCEMVGVGLDGKKNVLARVSLVNEHGNVIYDEYVKPSEYVTDFRTHISGIRYRDIKKGKQFSLVQKSISELLSGRIVVGHAIRNDFKVLLLTHPKSDIRDTCLYPPLRSSNGRSRSLKHLAEIVLGLKIQDGEHNSVEDARTAMLLYLKFKRDWERSYAGRRGNNKSVRQ